ncbi:unnamed protein product, partial [Didymodactylos carnosus]
IDQQQQQQQQQYLSRSGSNEYFIRNGQTMTANEYTRTLHDSESSSGTATRYIDDNNIKQILEMDENGEQFMSSRSLLSPIAPDVKNYPINVDPNPELIVRPNTQRLTYTHDVAVRYLRPPTPPPPGPIIIREIRAPPPPVAPPIILRQRPPPPRTPSPVIIRERPPNRPKSVPTTVIKKVIPAPAPPPRKLIIERLPNLPPKPRPVIIERWLPYNKQKRQVVHERAKPLEPMARIKNTIIEWKPPEVELVKHVKKLGIQQADPVRYYQQYGDKLYTTDFIQRKFQELGLQDELIVLQQQQQQAHQSVTNDNELYDLQNSDGYNLRQIMSEYHTSSPQSTSRQYSSLVRLLNEEDIDTSQINIDQIMNDQVYDIERRSPTNQNSVVYDSSSSGGGILTHSNIDNIDDQRYILTEEILRRNYENSGKFPTHLLTKLGSNAYDMPYDQSVGNGNQRLSNRKYYDDTSQSYQEEKYVQIKSSDLKDVINNYDVYTTTSGTDGGT